MPGNIGKHRLSKLPDLHKLPYKASADIFWVTHALVNYTTVFLALENPIFTSIFFNKLLGKIRG